MFFTCLDVYFIRITVNIFLQNYGKRELIYLIRLFTIILISKFIVLIVSTGFTVSIL